MPRAAFSPVRVWVFDLDNTLYPPSADLFGQIDRLMSAFISEALEVGTVEADRLRQEYWRRYGTTLAGLMRHHGVRPEAFLDRVHRIDLSGLGPDPTLAAAIAALPGRRIVHTNGPRAHGHRVLSARGLTEAFEAVYGIEDTGFEPKPRPAAFDAVARAAGIDPRAAAMIEDDPRNLVVPHRRGMRTLLVSAHPEPALPRHVHHVTGDLAGFLSALAGPAPVA